MARVSIPQRGLDSVCSRPSRQPILSSRRRPRVNMGLFGLGFPELAVIAGVGIFIFGPSKVAEMGKELGGFAGGMKKATAEFKEAMEDSLAEADRELEKKKVEKESVNVTAKDTSDKAIEESSVKE